MNILVTNDDGSLAPGIACLVEHLRKIGTVYVIAPDRNMSGISSGLTIETPIRMQEVRPNWWQINGTPTDCAKIALSGFLSDEPDILVSGINAGPNLGDDVIYSGTVGGAIEGRYLRMPSIAVSLATRDSDKLYDTAGEVVVNLIKQLKRQPIENGITLNVNVPNLPFDELKGMQITRQGDRHFSEPYTLTTDGRNKPIYWLGDAGGVKDGSPGTDFHAVSEGYVSITPLQVDMTAHNRINSLATSIGFRE